MAGAMRPIQFTESRESSGKDATKTLGVKAAVKYSAAEK